MNDSAYLIPQEARFQISRQTVKPFNLEVGEHRDIESQNYLILTNSNEIEKYFGMFSLLTSRASQLVIIIKEHKKIVNQRFFFFSRIIFEDFT